MTATACAADILAAVDTALDVLQAADELQTRQRPAEGKWCAREILGHLVDSACNNHRRFVIGQDGGAVVFDGYDQNAWVRRQRWAEVPFSEIVVLWAAYNRHLAHVVAAAPEETLAYAGRAPDGTGEVTLGFVMEDYVRHLRHHLEQLRALLTA